MQQSFADILLPSFLMLFKYLVSLSNITLLALFTVLILKIAIVELWQAVKDQRFVEVVHNLGINIGSILLCLL